jgi:hypothetical protein
MNPALLSSNYGAYLTPPEVVGRYHKYVKALDQRNAEAAGVAPCEKLPPFGDYFSNEYSIVGARWTATIEQDGNSVDWGANRLEYWPRAAAYCNPEYGSAIEAACMTMVRFGHDLRTCEVVGLLPARPDTAWCQGLVMRTMSAAVAVKGRLTFWKPIPLDDPRPAGERVSLAKRRGEDEKAYKKRMNDTPRWIRRYWPEATMDTLPAPFRRSRVEGMAVGPELSWDGKPCPAPFPSLIPYWGDNVDLFVQAFHGLGGVVVRENRALDFLLAALAKRAEPGDADLIEQARRLPRGGYFPRRGS